MTKSFRTFAAMASAIVTILIANWVAAAPRIVQKGKEVIAKGKEAVKTAKEGYKAAEQANEIIGKWNAHTKAFLNDLSPLDFIGGGSWMQGLFLWMVMASVTLHLVRKWDKKDVFGLSVGYGVGLLASLGFKYLLTAPIEDAKSIAYAVLALAAAVLVVMILMTGGPYLEQLRLARDEGAVLKFLLRRKLPKHTAADETYEEDEEGQEEGEASPDDQSEEGDTEEDEEETDEGDSSEPEPPEPDPEPPLAPCCPQCDRPLEPGARFCGFCPSPSSFVPRVQWVESPTMTCPSCGKETEAGVTYCGFCPTLLTPPAPGETTRKPTRGRRPTRGRTRLG